MKTFELGEQWSEEELKTHRSYINEGRRLFLGLSLIGLLFLSCFFWLLCYFIHPRLKEFSILLPPLVGFIIAVPLIFLALQLLSIVLTTLIEKNCLLLAKKRPLVIVILTPLVYSIGNLLGIHKDRIRNSFLKLNNSIVRVIGEKIKANRLLILLPRCIQFLNCKQKVIEDIGNCKKCGKCDVVELLKIKERHGLDILFATGGSVARRLIASMKPKAIIAVACERELISGIDEVADIPVIALPNERPEGPCKNTRVNYVLLEEAVQTFLGH